MSRLLKIGKLLLLALGLTFALNVSAQEKRHYAILPIGDSITEGSKKHVTYTYPLWKMMKEAGYDFEFKGSRTRTFNDIGSIHNCGFGGKTIEYLDKEIESIWKKYPSDIVLLHAGHNHFVEKKPVPGMIEAHGNFIDKVLALNPDAKIFVAQVIQSGKLPKYSYIPEFNRELKKLVKSYHSKNVILVNAGKGFCWKKHTVDDHVHPNAEGADVIAKNFMKSIRKHVDP